MASGEVADYPPAVQAELRELFARSASLDPRAVGVEVTAASVRIKVTITVPDAQDVIDVSSTLSPLLATPAAATRFLAGITLAGGTAIQVASIQMVAPHIPSPPPVEQPPTPWTPNASLANVQAGQKLSDGVKTGDGIATWMYVFIGGISVLALILLLVALLFGWLLFRKRRLKFNPSVVGAQGIALQSVSVPEPEPEARRSDVRGTRPDYYAAVIASSSSGSSSLPAYEKHEFTEGGASGVPEVQHLAFADDDMDQGTSATMPSLLEDQPLEDLTWAMPIGTSRPEASGESLREDANQRPGPPVREESGASSVGASSVYDSSRSESSTFDWEPPGADREQLYRSKSWHRSERI